MAFIISNDLKNKSKVTEISRGDVKTIWFILKVKRLGNLAEVKAFIYNRKLHKKRSV